jgi:hypothetical protein
VSAAVVTRSERPAVGGEGSADGTAGGGDGTGLRSMGGGGDDIAPGVSAAANLSSRGTSAARGSRREFSRGSAGFSLGFSRGATESTAWRLSGAIRAGKGCRSGWSAGAPGRLGEASGLGAAKLGGTLGLEGFATGAVRSLSTAIQRNSAVAVATIGTSQRDVSVRQAGRAAGSKAVRAIEASID